MKKRLVLLMCAIFAVSAAINAQNPEQQLADAIVKYQMKSGGWPKNQDWLKGPDMEVMKQCQKTGIGSTIDNGATVNELRALAKGCDKVYDVIAQNMPGVDNKLLMARVEVYRESFYRGIEYLLKMQYENGGWPQFYPAKKNNDYSSQITFNDNAIVNVMKLLKEVGTGAPAFKNMEVSKSMKKDCMKAFDKGIQCILDCQIRVDSNGKVIEYGTEEWKQGTRTVWCQQHDKKTLAPVKGRAYELPSFTAQGETVDILLLLMDITLPTPEVKEAINAAVDWLEEHAIKDTEIEHFTNADGKKDIKLVNKPGAPLLWARFYDLENAEPMYCGRDGIAKKNLSEIEYERRNGYQWIGDGPSKVIKMYR